jgi:hypothetical protein
MKKLLLALFSVSAAGTVFAQGLSGSVLFIDYSWMGTTHVWGPSITAPTLSLVGYGSNDSPSGTTPFRESGMSLIGSSGTGGRYGSSTTLAQLLFANGADQPEGSLQPGGQTTTFRTGASLGRINFITDNIVGLVPDEPAATFEMVAWDNSSQLYPSWAQASAAWSQGLTAAGKSGAFTLADIGGEWNTPPTMLPPSFNLYFLPASEIPQVPEPAMVGFVGLGLAGFWLRNRVWGIGFRI